MIRRQVSPNCERRIYGKLTHSLPHSQNQHLLESNNTQLESTTPNQNKKKSDSLSSLPTLLDSLPLLTLLLLTLFNSLSLLTPHLTLLTPHLTRVFLNGLDAFRSPPGSFSLRGVDFAVAVWGSCGHGGGGGGGSGPIELLATLEEEQVLGQMT